MSCWLITGDGTRVRVGRGGLVIGRRSDCGLVLADPGVSRRHALVRETIAETGAASMKDMGCVMKAVLDKAAGRADGGRVSPLVKSLLSG